MEKLRMNVQGRVQGVGFRYMTKMVADQLGVTGSVKKHQKQLQSKKSLMLLKEITNQLNNNDYGAVSKARRQKA